MLSANLIGLAGIGYLLLKSASSVSIGFVYSAVNVNAFFVLALYFVHCRYGTRVYVHVFNIRSACTVHKTFGRPKDIADLQIGVRD